MEQRLRAVFAQALGLTDVAVEAVRYREHPNWDSLGHMALVLALEDEFGVELEPGLLTTITSFDAALVTLRGVGVRG